VLRAALRSTMRPPSLQPWFNPRCRPSTPLGGGYPPRPSLTRPSTSAGGAGSDWADRTIAWKRVHPPLVELKEAFVCEVPRRRPASGLE
jgi:hypothetical protein